VGPFNQASGWKHSDQFKRFKEGAQVATSSARDAVMFASHSQVIPSGDLTKNYGKSPFIVNFPIKNCEFP